MKKYASKLVQMNKMKYAPLQPYVQWTKYILRILYLMQEKGDKIVSKEFQNLKEKVIFLSSIRVSHSLEAIVIY